MVGASNVALINNFLMWYMCAPAVCVLFLHASHFCMLFCYCMSVITACRLLHVPCTLLHMCYCCMRIIATTCVLAASGSIATCVLLLHVCWSQQVALLYACCCCM